LVIFMSLGHPLSLILSDTCKRHCERSAAI
jgi:hypothetical protein